MIQPNELRIGNWVHRPNLRCNDCIDRHAFEWLERGEEMYGIPLTEEWLVKLGFANKPTDPTQWRMSNEDYDHFQVTIHPGLKVCSFSQDYYVDEEMEKTVPHLVNHIEYVHQLQNLFFALTGEELTVNEALTK